MITVMLLVVIAM